MNVTAPNKPTLDEFVTGLQLLVGHLTVITSARIGTIIVVSADVGTVDIKNTFERVAEAHGMPIDDIHRGYQDSTYMYVDQEYFSFEG